MDKPKNVGGRPPKPPDEKLIPRTVLLKQAHWDKIDVMGWDWLRKLIDRARPEKWVEFLRLRAQKEKEEGASQGNIRGNRRGA